MGLGDAISNQRLRIAQGGRNGWIRLTAASKIDFSLNLLNLAAKCYLVYFTIIFALARLRGDTVSVLHALLFVASSIISTIVPFIPRPRKKRWMKEEIKRAKSTGVAVHQIATGISIWSNSAVELHRVCQGLLSAIKSEVEMMVGDTEGVYIRVALLIPDPNGDPNLLVFCRSDEDRPTDITYPRESVLVWKAMKSQHWEYEPNFVADASKPYRCVLAYPIIFSPPGGNLLALGGVSIDSERGNHFDGLGNKLETRLIPYRSLLQLALICNVKRAEGVAHASS